MSYVDATYYADEYLGAAAPADELERLLNRASDDVDAAAGHSFIFADLIAQRQQLVKKAVCAQAEYYVMNGETFNTGGVQSEGIGKYQYNKGDSNAGAFAPRMLQYIEAAGLAFRGVSR